MTYIRYGCRIVKDPKNRNLKVLLKATNIMVLFYQDQVAWL